MQHIAVDVDGQVAGHGVDVPEQHDLGTVTADDAVHVAHGVDVRVEARDPHPIREEGGQGPLPAGNRRDRDRGAEQLHLVGDHFATPPRVR